LTPISDNEIMENVRDGRIEKLAILFERHHISLFNFFLRLTGSPNVSEDLVQEVFLRVLKYRKSYQGRSKFRVWMFQIARNAHIDYLRKKKDAYPLEDQFFDVRSEEAEPDDSMVRSQEAARLNQALSKLPLKKREVLILSRYQDMKYKEIADLFGCQIGTVKTYVHRALKDLNRIYLELNGDLIS
jgi:RNA polymerase sigma factor (sigma-70 family)